VSGARREGVWGWATSAGVLQFNHSARQDQSGAWSVATVRPEDQGVRPARLLVLLGTVVSTTKWGDGLASGTKHSLWITPDGTVAAWGDNTNGQLGDRTSTVRLSPMQVPGLADVVAVAAGAYRSLAVTSGGTLRASC
jgi:hypothetical protein